MAVEDFFDTERNYIDNDVIYSYSGYRDLKSFMNATTTLNDLAKEIEDGDKKMRECAPIKKTYFAKAGAYDALADMITSLPDPSKDEVETSYYDG